MGGWLGFMQINMYFSLAYFSNYFFRSLLPIYAQENWGDLTSPEGDYYNPYAKGVFILESLSTVVLMGLIVVALVLMYRKKAAFPPIMICYFVLTVLFDIGTNMMFQRFLTYEDLSGADKEQYMDTGLLIKRFLFCSAWVAYLIRSKRVKNTFIQ
nr:DUF2569 family protein [Paenibacillus dendrobii]